MSPRINTQLSGDRFHGDCRASVRRSVVGAFVGLALGANAFFVAPAALAHDAVISSVPADRQVVQEFPREVVLSFSGDPKENFNTVAVSDSDAQKVLYSHEPTVMGNQVTLPIPDDVNPGPGNYLVGFQITSSDGHSTRGKISFKVADEASADAEGKQTEVQSRDGAAEDSSAVPLWAYGLGGGLIVLIAVVVVVINRKARS